MTVNHRRTLFMKFTITLDRDEDGVWIMECPSIPGCVSQGQTKEEALENIKDAILQVCVDWSLCFMQ
jgi:predicted RNase H-like HicB family nuclease